MNISMAVCTYNRLDYLKETIGSLLNQTITKDPTIEWELLVIDNNSPDGTKEYVTNLEKHHPNLRYIHESQQGSGYSRNAALKNARYDIVAYIDDDETADENWAKEIIRVFEKHPDAGCAGGPYYLEDKESIPDWVPVKMYGILGDVYLDKKDGEIYQIDRVGLGGGNMAISRKVIDKGISFPLKGRLGEILLADEDTEMCYAIYDAGFKMFYNPKAIAHHKLIKSRITFSYFAKNAKGMAYTRGQKWGFIKYFIEMLYFAIIFPFRTALNYKNRFLYFMRIVGAYYKMERSIKLILNK